jgi:hypothetical protein
MPRTPFAYNVLVRGCLPEQPRTLTLPPVAPPSRGILALVLLSLRIAGAGVAGVVRWRLDADDNLVMMVIYIRKTDFVRAPSGTRGSWLVAFPATAVIKVFSAAAAIGWRALTRLEEDAPVFGAVGWWWRERAVHRCQSPFLHIRLDEDEAELAEVYVHGTRAVRAERGEEVEGFKAVRYVVEFFAVTCEEDSATAGTVSDAYHIALDEGGPIGCACEGLVVAAVAGRSVGERVFMPSYSCQSSVNERHSFPNPRSRLTR